MMTATESHQPSVLVALVEVGKAQTQYAPMKKIVILPVVVKVVHPPHLIVDAIFVVHVVLWTALDVIWQHKQIVVTI